MGLRLTIMPEAIMPCGPWVLDSCRDPLTNLSVTLPFALQTLHRNGMLVASIPRMEPLVLTRSFHPTPSLCFVSSMDMSIGQWGGPSWRCFPFQIWQFFDSILCPLVPMMWLNVVTTDWPWSWQIPLSSLTSRHRGHSYSASCHLHGIKGPWQWAWCLKLSQSPLAQSLVCPTHPSPRCTSAPRTEGQWGRFVELSWAMFFSW